MRFLACSVCATLVPLADRRIRCGCGRSFGIIRAGTAEFSGPARVLIPVPPAGAGFERSEPLLEDPFARRVPARPLL